MKREKPVSKAPSIYMTIVSIFYGLLWLVLMALFIYFRGKMPNIGMQGAVYLGMLAGSSILLWLALVTFLVYHAGNLMRERKTLKKGIILTFITAILSFFSPFIIIGGIMGIVSFIRAKRM